MNRLFCVLLTALSLAACSSMKVVEIDPHTGHFPTNTKATVVLDKRVDLDAMKSLLVIEGNDFVKGQIENIHYFDKVMKYTDLEKKIIQANLTDKVPSMHDRIGLSKAATYYKDFLWFHTEVKGTRPNQRVQFILTNAKNMDDYFITETKLDYVWIGVNDQNNWYPMFNALIDYIKQNSRTYGK